MSANTMGGDRPRNEHDFYATDPALALAICEGLRDRVGLCPNLIIEPSAGSGAFVRAAFATWPRTNVYAVEPFQPITTSDFDHPPGSMLTIEATTWEQCAQHVEAGGVVEVLGGDDVWRASGYSAPFYRHCAAAPGTGGWFRRRLLPLPAAARATTEPTGARHGRCSPAMSPMFGMGRCTRRRLLKASWLQASPSARRSSGPRTV